MLSRRNQPIGRATLEFDGGTEGPHEKGVYSFWSAIGSGRCTIVRTLPGRTVESWFNEYGSMDRVAIDQIENIATEIRPSAWSEICEWLKTHVKDARNAKMSTLNCEEL